MPKDEHGDKWACEPCIRGHRSSKCEHYERLMIRVKKPGRPLSKCPHPPGSCSCRLDRVMMVRISTGSDCRCVPRYAVEPDGTRVPFPLKQEPPDASANSAIPKTEHIDSATSSSSHSNGEVALDKENGRLTGSSDTLTPSAQSIPATTQPPNDFTAGAPTHPGSGSQGVAKATQDLRYHHPAAYGSTAGGLSGYQPGQPIPAGMGGMFMANAGMSFAPQNYGMWPAPTQPFPPHILSRQQYDQAPMQNSVPHPFGPGISSFIPHFHNGRMTARPAQGYHNGQPTGRVNASVGANGTIDSHALVQTSSGHICNCGSTCKCFACPEHPYNTTTVPRVHKMASILAQDLSSDHSPRSPQDSPPPESGSDPLSPTLYDGDLATGMNDLQHVQARQGQWQAQGHEQGPSLQTSRPFDRSSGLEQTTPVFDNSDYLEFEFPVPYDADFLDMPGPEFGGDVSIDDLKAESSPGDGADGYVVTPLAAPSGMASGGSISEAPPAALSPRPCCQ